MLNPKLKFEYFLNFEQSNLSDHILMLDEELTNKNVGFLVTNMLKLLEKNDVAGIQKLKKMNAANPNFNIARKYLDLKCKKIWDVFSPELANIPTECMKILGVSNVPPLKNLLETSLSLSENENSSATSKVIDKILTNKNLGYTINDIHNFLKIYCKENNLSLSQTTIKYLVYKRHYGFSKIQELNVKVKNNKIKLRLFLNDLANRTVFRYFLKTQ